MNLGCESDDAVVVEVTLKIRCAEKKEDEKRAVIPSAAGAGNEQSFLLHLRR